VRGFERSLPNALWQIDILTFQLKRMYRVYLVGIIDDHSRFLVGWGLFRQQGAEAVLKVLNGALGQWGAPREILSDNGRQFVAWRGKTRFQKVLKQQGIDGACPVDRFYGLAEDVDEALRQGCQESALRLALGQEPRSPLYLLGQLGNTDVRVTRKGDAIEVRVGDAVREVIRLGAPYAIGEDGSYGRERMRETTHIGLPNHDPLGRARDHLTNHGRIADALSPQAFHERLGRGIPHRDQQPSRGLRIKEEIGKELRH
jgi:hypothetical protein